MSLELSLIEWLELTTAAMAAMTPIYVIMGKMLCHIAEMRQELTGLKTEFISIVKNCPYCMRKRDD